ncbi:MAG TPA: hypothetical protein VGK30_07640 [Candidatus Binatia bacterium]|jgi:hypothetical protein
MRSRRRRLVPLLVLAFVAHLLCVCAQPALAASSRVQGAAQASAHACCRKGAPSQSAPKRGASECRYCSAPQLSPDAPRLAAPALSPAFVVAALPSVFPVALARSHGVPAFGCSADPPPQLALSCILLI